MIICRKPIEFDEPRVYYYWRKDYAKIILVIRMDLHYAYTIENEKYALYNVYEEIEDIPTDIFIGQFFENTKDIKIKNKRKG